MSRSDPIRKNYYDSVESADKTSDRLFYISALLSFAALLVDRDKYPDFYTVISIALGVSVLALCVIGLVLRLYLMPRAEDKRRQDFFSSSCGISLTHENTDGYYNNNFVEPTKRIAAQLLENSHFTKSIVLEMARTERLRISVYAILWVVCLMFRRNDLGVVLVASQAVFSEQVLAKWFRLEWLRMRSEKVFDDVFALFQSKAADAEFNAMTLASLSMYETAKANAAVTLSSKIFDKLNPSLSKEWDKIKEALKI